MPTPGQIHHLGNNVWFLDNFGASKNHQYYGGSSVADFLTKTKEKTQELIETSNGRYFLAVTANILQKDIGHKCLKELKFKPIISCYSSYGQKNETLTLWARIREQKPKISGEKINSLTSYNCSVDVMVEENSKDNQKRLTISTFERPEFVRVMKAPIYYRIFGPDDWGKSVDVDWNKE